MAPYLLGAAKRKDITFPNPPAARQHNGTKPLAMEVSKTVFAPFTSPAQEKISCPILLRTTLEAMH